MKERLSTRISKTAAKKLKDYMTRHDLSKTEAVESILLSINLEEMPAEKPKIYHAEVSEHNSMVRCPIGIHKDKWVRASACMQCSETQCDIKSGST